MLTSPFFFANFNPKVLGCHEGSNQRSLQVTAMERTIKKVSVADQRSCSSMASGTIFILALSSIISNIILLTFHHCIATETTQSRQRGSMDEKAIPEALKKRRREKERAERSTFVKALLSSLTASEKQKRHFIVRMDDDKVDAPFAKMQNSKFSPPNKEVPSSTIDMPSDIMSLSADRSGLRPKIFYSPVL